jgi:hypothetical protein
VEDTVAAWFSHLYEEFINKRKPLGEAVVEARQRLLTERGNPLGLVYTFYSDPNLGIAPAGQHIPSSDNGKMAAPSLT